MALPTNETPCEALARLLAKVRWTKTSLADASGYSLRSIHRWLEPEAPLPVPKHVLDTLGFLANMTEKAEEQFAHAKHLRAATRRRSEPNSTHSVADIGFARAMAEIELLKARLANYEKAPFYAAPPPPTPLKPKES